MARTIAMGCVLAMACACLAQNQQYHAKLVLDNGADLPSAPLFSPPPAGQDLPVCNIVNAFANGLIIYIVPVVIDPGSDPITHHWDDKCMITVWLKGYRKADVALHDGAVITLKPIGDPEGSTVSVTALHVPKEAAKAYDKGLQALTDGKLRGAQKQFERAVAFYPDYARAWSQLGEVLEQQSQPKEAADACQRALQADPKYIRPYLQLIRLAVNGKRMEDATVLGEQAFRLDPVEFPGIFYYDAVANYELKHADAAEKSVRRTIDLDKSHDYPAAEALLGKILADKGDVHGALEHFTKYVKLAPKADDVGAIRQRMDELERAGQPEK
ncbi:MAG TPA: tetratricopeptide repeat protein [Bryobacteraceae bacterium]|nr:tetratricopeptide repeat protein [Bryobacteraceae bacterium]